MAGRLFSIALLIAAVSAGEVTTTAKLDCPNGEAPSCQGQACGSDTDCCSGALCLRIATAGGTCLQARPVCATTTTTSSSTTPKTTPRMTPATTTSTTTKKYAKPSDCRPVKKNDHRPRDL